jgi:hypothetical protein
VTEFEMNMAALRRPLDYGQRHPQSQWSIDAGLGILDWDGLNIAAAEKCIEASDETQARTRFKMSLGELVTVVNGWHARFAQQKKVG